MPRQANGIQGAVRSQGGSDVAGVVLPGRPGPDSAHDTLLRTSADASASRSLAFQPLRARVPVALGIGRQLQMLVAHLQVASTARARAEVALTRAFDGEGSSFLHARTVFLAAIGRLTRAVGRERLRNSGQAVNSENRIAAITNALGRCYIRTTIFVEGFASRFRPLRMTVSCGLRHRTLLPLRLAGARVLALRPRRMRGGRRGMASGRARTIANAWTSSSTAMQTFPI
jgi:hypothetical protein